MTDAAYLKSTVGDALSKGMAQVAVSQPNDAVDFLGQFLLNYYATKVAERDAAVPAPADDNADAAPAEDPAAVAQREGQQRRRQYGRCRCALQRRTQRVYNTTSRRHLV